MKTCSCPCHSVGGAVCGGCAGKHQFTASAPALSAEERAERAWSVFAAGYYVPDEPLVSDSTLFKAGYLARDKEKP